MSLGNDWIILGNAYFRKLTVYETNWGDDVDLNRMKIAIAPYGGHIATLSSTARNASESSSSRLIIRNAAGEILREHSYLDSPALDLVWTQHEELLVIQEIGRVNIYNLFGDYIKNFGLPTAAEGNPVLDCRSYILPSGGTGLAFLTDQRFQIFYVNNVQSQRDHRVISLPDLGIGAGSRPPSAWTVFVDVQSDNGGQNVCALVARDKSLYRLEQGRDCVKLNVAIQADFTAILSLSVSLNHKLLALFTDSGHVWAGDVDDVSVCHYEHCMEDEQLRGGVRPKQMLWCSVSALLLSWPNTLQVIGPDTETIDFFYEDAFHLSSEVDGCRIITARGHELFQRIPPALENLGKIGANSGAYFLFDAEQKLRQRSGQAHDSLQAIMGSASSRSGGSTDSRQGQQAMLEAVKQCLTAAAHAWSVDEQQALLRAARLGRGFLTMDEIAYDFSVILKKMRLLNFLRAAEPICMPLTFRQLESLGMSRLVDRLLIRKHYPLAITIAHEMELPAEHGLDHILAYWASQKVYIPRSHNIKYGVHQVDSTLPPDPDSDEKAKILALEIYTRLKAWDRCHVSYAEIALRALESGRRKLAEQLLEYETKASEQVNLWLRLAIYPKALSRAVDSGDPELILFTLNTLRRVIKSKATLFNIIKHHPTALVILQRMINPNLDSIHVPAKSANAEADAGFEQECKELLNSWKSLSGDQPAEKARMTLKSAFTSTDFKQRKLQVTMSRDDFKKSTNEFMTHECDQYLRLLDSARELHSRGKRPLNSERLSVQMVLREMIVLGDVKLIEQAKRDFKVPDKRFWTLRLEIMAQQEQWPEIEKLSRSRKKLPVGFEVFVEVCLKQLNVQEGLKYVQKIDADKRVRYLYKLGRVDDAINLAAEQQSLDDLNYLQWNLSKTDRQAYDKIQAIRKQLS